jgi:peptidoglycan/LPS O-acetylase OafA/YrhL
VGVAFALSFFPKYWPLLLANKVLGSLPAWWMGALPADKYTRRIRIGFVWLIPLVALFAMFGMRTLSAEAKTAILGLACAGLISLCLVLQAQGYSLQALCRLKWLGDMSYTLYVIHMPILVFISGLFLLRRPGNTLPDSFGLMVAGIFVALVVAWLAHFVVERPISDHGGSRPNRWRRRGQVHISPLPTPPG